MRLLILVGLVGLLSGCGMGAEESVTGGEAEQTNECPGPAECTTNNDCDAKCGGPGSGVCYAWTCYCAA
jgi:hypothetical protein